MVLVAGLVLCLGRTLGAAEDADAAHAEFFETKVRPLLAARCYECHGPQEKRPKGGLSLDSRTAILAGGDSGPAIVSGDPAESLLIQAINYESFEMPPRSRLPKGEVAILTEWVRRGAPWPNEKETARGAPAVETFPLQELRASHWAWQPIVEYVPPTVAQRDWPLDPVDHFILANLEEHDLAPAAAADRRTLIRRAYFDLIGLPPSPADVQAFLDDPDNTPQAFARVVHRLLASPRFGERWARHWLDLVRYAETLGHEFDYPLAHAWRYRDYVIRALNADVPYDQLVGEHIAGDLLPNPRRHSVEGFNESIIGTGFWWLGEAKQAPVDSRGEEAAMIDNQIDVFTKTFLGMTVACARCHDHKFDAISTQDYYALCGFLQSSRRQEAWLDPGSRITTASRQLEKLRREANAVLTSTLPDSGEMLSHALLASSTEQWNEARRDPADPFHAWGVFSQVPAADLTARREELRKHLSGGVNEASETELFEDFNAGSFEDWFVSGWAFGDGPATPGRWYIASDKPTLAHSGIAHSGLLSNKLRGVVRSRTFTITHPEILYRLAGENARVRLIIDGYYVIEFHSLLFSGISFEVNTEGKFVWHRQSGDLSRYIGHRAWIEIIDDGDGWIAVDEIRFANAGAEPPSPPNPLTLDWLHDETLSTREALAALYGELWQDSLRRWRAGTLDFEGNDFIATALAKGLVPADDLQKAIRDLADRISAIERDIPDPIAVHAITDGTGEDERVHIRGSHTNLGSVVPRRMLEAVSGPDQSLITRGSGRLELAERLLDPSNPLPARVMVNRLWHHLFGRGLVASVDNFGVLGEEPTHPELLDHLAAEFIRDGWSVKRTIRRLMLSRTYQMSSLADAATRQRDPQNRLLHAMPVRRLEGEAIRDAILAVSGHLDHRMFGPSVPVHLTPFMQGRGRPEQSGPLDGDGRRSIYQEVRRNFPSPMMAAFDTPTPFTTIGRRNVSNVPAQALILMNDPFVIEQAKLWARRILAEPHHTAGERVRRLYETVFARPPSDGELRDAVHFLQTQAAASGLAADQWQHDSHVWADLCHALMNTKEFIFLN
jgi:hypothetical protein